MSVKTCIFYMFYIFTNSGKLMDMTHPPPGLTFKHLIVKLRTF